MNASASEVAISFTIYSSVGMYNAALVVSIFVLYVSGLCVSLVLVVAICIEPHLHRPMYILLANLAASGVMGSSSVCPTMLVNLLKRQREASLPACLMQAFFTNVYGGCVFCILALMAFDRYVSICKPLLYHAIMTPVRVRLMLLAVYSALCSSSAVQVLLTSRLALCRHAIDKLLCDALAVANLSCESTALISVYGLCCATVVVALPCFLVVLSYVHIFIVTMKLSAECRRRALQTCIPHLVAFINFSAASFFGVIYNRLSSNVPHTINFLTCFNFFVIPTLLHPVVYGVKMQEIRQSINKMMKDRISFQTIVT